ncbi:membrane protein insertase YidC [Candidatus Albibeggiatoa sp. nov. NOAA]|uniref:membrane protein insertase YidC n=1 Tax=Candidatus Albibeggiatoa sp. nov. NOAA TaxID=3162724 RepID=UPI0032FACCC4|nr:membrane protein insertase YidC [Thiotrichaceae bacterium]
MDNVRLILVLALVFLMMMMYQEWLEDYGPKPVPSTPTVAATDGATTQDAMPTPTTTGSAEVPSIATPSMTSAGEMPFAQPKQVLSTQQRVQVKTDLFNLEIDTLGGDIRQVALVEYPVANDKPDEPYTLMQDAMPRFFVAQSGLMPADYAPTHQTAYQTQQLNYDMGDADSLEVVLSWQNAQGVTVNKVFTFQRDSYVINVKHVVDNKTAEPWTVRAYSQLQRTEVAEEGQSSFIYTYMGGAISSPDQLYEKVDFGEMRDSSFNQENRPEWANGWAAMLQHYFVAAWVPEKDQLYKYYTNFIPSGSRYVLGLYGQPFAVPAQAQHQFEMNLFVGPKLQDELEALSSGLDLTVDYGWLWPLAKPLFWTLQFIHEWIGNWGWAIIILTILIKLAFFHLSATSYKSMANMRKLQPRLKQLQERYADDRNKLNQAMMDMYRKEKINPLGGCLPILVQIPVFIALYWVLLESVELRQAPFMLWLDDLSAPDPYFVLPLIMGASMFLQHHLNPAPLDPVQQKVMMMLPIVFTVFFAFFPSGLVLYWVVNNVLSIAQQWVITKKIESGEAA